MAHSQHSHHLRIYLVSVLYVLCFALQVQRKYRVRDLPREIKAINAEVLQFEEYNAVCTVDSIHFIQLKPY